MEATEGTLEHIDKRFGEDATKQAISLIKETHEAPEEFMERLVTFGNVLKAGRYKATDYVKAVQYTTYRSMDMTMKDAFMQTYPERCYRGGERKPEGTIDALASLYDKTKLVQSILAQMQIPLHIMMMNERVRAANVLAHLMVNSDSEKIQMESADKFLNHVAVPETMKIEMDIGIKTDDTIAELNETLNKLADMAQNKISQGAITPTELVERR